MIDAKSLTHTIDQFLGGSDGRYRHPLNRRFIYTEGVKAVADRAGAHWLLDIIATEIAPMCIERWKSQGDPTSFIEFAVRDGRGTLRVVPDTDIPPFFTRTIDYTDFPAGDWVFELAMDGLIDAPNEVLVMLLLTEH